jgi:hypothetical protein
VSGLSSSQITGVETIPTNATTTTTAFQPRDTLTLPLARAHQPAQHGSAYSGTGTGKMRRLVRVR